eukprot:CAMPEP_0172157028 /NCGR_PEP_ID=MMETSP1050-20130122/3557_1 /TAXON_ID=233186 /ORGANISM="Cryptomonas curvata, Strain CCAP979/52" /LENGTH=88 /DNA_ID=CAMNT_0012826199 /DNA_START=874 /DNA_END=1138 /DNA_ORIENTATION=+
MTTLLSDEPNQVRLEKPRQKATVLKNYNPSDDARALKSVSGSSCIGMFRANTENDDQISIVMSLLPTPSVSIFSEQDVCKKAKLPKQE